MIDRYIKTDSVPARVVQITDTHLGADRSFLFSGVSTLDSLARVIDVIARDEQPDLVLVTGDLVHDPVESAYAMLLEQLERFSCPVHCLPGNHDDPVIMEGVLNRNNVSTDKVIRVNDWQILLLNSFVPGTHGGRLSEDELVWLNDRLQQESSNTLIALHHPPVRIDSPWMDAMMLSNPAEFFSVIEAFPSVQAVIWGHIHQEFSAQRGAIRLLACPSTCLQFKPKSLVFQTDNLAPGYRLLNLPENGPFSTQVIRLTD
ncbi:MAG: 3',5'-cyclic-AMP phosphodiesterase [Thiotrichales bacterium]|nr:3',5'-cyclic-AMP phosphodiesterase [Thiotrichales bacterium]